MLRTTTKSYYNPATSSGSSNVYAKRQTSTATPRILSALQETITGASRAQLSYDNQAYGSAPTAGNLTRESGWDDRASGWINTTHGYDVFGNRTSTTDPRGNLTTLVYDASTHAQPTGISVDPLNGTGQQTTTIVYDYWTGLVTRQTDANSQPTDTSYINQITSAFDPYGRPGVVTDRRA